MGKRTFRAGLVAIAVASAVVAAGAQEPPPLPPPPAPSHGPAGIGLGPGGPMAGMFEFGALVGAFGGKVVTGKPLQATYTITRTQTLPGNSIRTTSTGTLARDADGSTYRDVNFGAIGPLSAAGTPRHLVYIRNLSKMTEYFVNVAGGTYIATPLHQHEGGPGAFPFDRGNASANETVTDNPNATYTDPVTHSVYKADDRKTTRTIPAGQIGNQYDLVITSERWYAPDSEVLLQETWSDPRFGTSTYQLSNIGQPQASLFVPDPSFTQVQGRGLFRGGLHGEGKQPPPPPQE